MLSNGRGGVAAGEKVPFDLDSCKSGGKSEPNQTFLVIQFDLFVHFIFQALVRRPGIKPSCVVIGGARDALRR